MYLGSCLQGQGGLEQKKGEIDYVRRKILLVCICFSLYLSCQRKLDLPYDWVGFEASLSSDMQHSMQKQEGDVWSVQQVQGAQGQMCNPSVSVAAMPTPHTPHTPRPDLPASPDDPLPPYIAKAQAKEGCVRVQCADERRQIETCTQGSGRGMER